MTHPSDFRQREIFSFAKPLLRMLVVGWLIAAALWYAVTTLLTIANFGWTQLAFDQFRSYTSTLGLPFPDNLMVLENGHRPIIPALVRVIEVHAFSANQFLQIGFGAFCAALAATLAAVTAWRETTYSTPVRAAGVLFAMTGILWLGNARMLLHGNESVAIYLVVVCAIAGALMVRRAAAQERARWMIGATLACVMATFCFAAGVALFPTLAVLAWLLGARWRHLAIILGAAALCAVLYLFVLSGDGGVRGSLHFRPIDSVVIAARWLASPWITGWLGFADPQTHDISLSTPLGMAMKTSANFLQGVLHLQWAGRGATLIGLAGLVVMVVGIVAQAFRRGPMTATRTIALALMMFAAATACLIGIGRLDYLQKHPGQIFADRYLPWGCLFWMGAGLLLLTAANHRRLWLRYGLLVFACILPIGMLPFHKYGAGWGASVYHLNQAGAAAALSAVFDDRLFYDNADATLQQRIRSYQLLHDNQLGPFRFAGADALDSLLSSACIVAPDDVRVAVTKVFAVADARDATKAATFEGVVAAGIRSVRSRGPLAVIDPQGRIVGYALISFVGKPMSALMLSLPVKRGFEGYVKGYDSSMRYRLISLDRNGTHGLAWDLAELPAATP